jgi:hypothetical protein
LRFLRKIMKPGRLTASRSAVYDVAVFTFELPVLTCLEITYSFPG